MIPILLACLGLTYILIHSKVLNKPRNFLKKNKFFSTLIRCHYCVGFWSGVFLMFLYNGPEKYLIPLISCYICGVAETIITKIERV